MQMLLRLSGTLTIFLAVMVPLSALTGQERSPSNSKVKPVETEKFFKNCTPAEFAEHDCWLLERIVSPFLREMNEKPLDSIPKSDDLSTYRLTLLAFTSPVPAQVARIMVHQDSTVEIIAKVGDPDGKVRVERQIRLSKEDSGKILGLLVWNTFVKTDSGRHLADDPTRRVRDGNICVLEGSEAGDFHAIERAQIWMSAPFDNASALLTQLYNILKSFGVWQLQ